MSARFVNIDHDTPMLLPPDLRDWLSPDHMVHFVMDAVKALDLSRADRCGKLPVKIGLHARLSRPGARRDRRLSGDGRYCSDSYFLL